MPIHDVAGVKVTVAFEDQNFLFARRQGVSASVNPRRRWYCLWLCSSTDRVNRIEIQGTLEGPPGAVAVQTSCANCGSATAWGPWFYGFSVPRAYSAVSYNGTIVNGSNTGTFSGSMTA